MGMCCLRNRMSGDRILRAGLAGSALLSGQGRAWARLPFSARPIRARPIRQQPTRWRLHRLVSPSPSRPIVRPARRASRAWPGPPGLDGCPASTAPSTDGLTRESAGASTRAGGRRRTVARPWCSASTARGPASSPASRAQACTTRAASKDRGSRPSFSLTARVTTVDRPRGLAVVVDRLSVARTRG
jgi:hypothetical protein